MDFNLSGDHQILADTLGRYLAGTCTIEARNRTAHAAPWHMPAVWAGLADLGIVGAFIPEAQGGLDGSAEVVRVIFEELGRGLCAEPLLGTLLGLRLLAGLGRADLTGAIVAGSARAALAVYEPHVACDLAHVESVARRAGDGWRLRGRKSAIYGAPCADHVLVAARGERGLGLYLLARPDLAAAGMIDGGGIADLVMDDLPAECLSEDCAALIEDALDLGRIALCAEAVGAMAHLVGLTVAYLGQRKQFGRPLAGFQALQHRVVDMLVELEQARSITIAAAAGFGTADQARMASLAKNLIGRAGIHISEEAIQMHGGIGMTWEYPGAHYAKRLVMIDHQLGDRHDHVLRLIRLGTAPAGAGQ